MALAEVHERRLLSAPWQNSATQLLHPDAALIRLVVADEAEVFTAEPKGGRVISG
jgi:hypothetical protein